MDDLLEVEFQIKSGRDILKELEEFYMLEKETEKSEARKVAVLMKGYLQSMKSNIREIIRYIDDTTLEKSNDKKKDKQESTSTIPEEVQEFVNLTITEHMGKAYSEWKLKQDKEPVSEIDKKYQELNDMFFIFFLLRNTYFLFILYTLSSRINGHVIHYHRNSMILRMQKIESILNMDFDSIADFYNIYVALEIQEYLLKIQEMISDNSTGE